MVRTSRDRVSVADHLVGITNSGGNGIDHRVVFVCECGMVNGDEGDPRGECIDQE